MRGHVRSQTSHADHGRSEILSGPADDSTSVSKKTLVIAASALVAVLAAGGVGYSVLTGSGGPDRGSTSTAPDRPGADRDAAGQGGADATGGDREAADRSGGAGGEDEARADDTGPGAANDSGASGDDADTAGGGAEKDGAAVGGAGERGAAGGGAGERGAAGDGTAGRPGGDTGRDRADSGSKNPSSTGSGSTGSGSTGPVDYGPDLADGPPGTVPGACAKTGC